MKTLHGSSLGSRANSNAKPQPRASFNVGEGEYIAMRFMKLATHVAAALPLLFPIACVVASSPASSQAKKSPHIGGQKGRTYAARENSAYDRVGVASWYGAQFHGRRTANGERFDMNALTAAHPTLPLSTVVRVTNLANDRSVTVRVNDRGPYAQGRLIDLSRASARVLGFEGQGTARVRVTVLGDRTAPTPDGARPAESDGDTSGAAASTSARGRPRPRPRRAQRRAAPPLPAGRGRPAGPLSYLRTRAVRGRRDGQGPSR